MSRLRCFRRVLGSVQADGHVTDPIYLSRPKLVSRARHAFTIREQSEIDQLPDAGIRTL